MGFRIHIVLRSFCSLHFLLSQLSAASRRWCRSSPPRLILPRFSLRGVCLTFTHHTTSSSDRLSPPDRLIFRRWTFFSHVLLVYIIFPCPFGLWSSISSSPQSCAPSPIRASYPSSIAGEKKKAVTLGGLEAPVTSPFFRLSSGWLNSSPLVTQS